MALYQVFSPLIVGPKADKPVIATQHYPQNVIISHDNDMSYDLQNTNFYVSRDKSVYRIPTYLLSKKDYEKIDKFQSKFEHRLATRGDYTLYVSMPVHAIKLNYSPYSYRKTLKAVTFMYEPTLWFKYQDNNNFVKLNKNSIKTKQSFMLKGFTINPRKWFDDNLTHFAHNFDYTNNFNLFWDNYDLAKQLNAQGKIFSEELANLFKIYGKNIDWTMNLLDNCSNYNLPLLQYKVVCDVLENLGITEAERREIISTNEYLLLISNIEDLHTIQNELPTVPTKPLINTKYNQDQIKAIVSNKPLNLLQSVAGSGKSTTILGRISYLLKQHIPAEDITVLSFTNAAADHITHAFSDQAIHSLTIAKMIHDIYQLNWSHHLSNTATLINSLYLNYGESNPIINQFAYYLNAMQNNEKQASVKTLHFVMEHEDKIVDMLNDIQQTTLSLEEIFCYIHIKDWQNQYTTKYLIVDEVQDTSIFQFIYLLRYAAVNKSNVFFVGDASQTLYEFRDADPDALNAIEATKYFTCYQLETNYRSNPAILMYANQVLNTVAANRYAHLKLHASGYDPNGKSNTKQSLTTRDFTDHVKYLHYPSRHLDKPNLESIINSRKTWLDDRLNLGQQIAVLTRSRKIADEACEVLQSIYPDLTVNNITSKPPAELTILSNYLRKYGTEIDYMPTSNLIDFLFIALRDKLNSLFPENMFDSIKKLLMPEIADLFNKLQNDLNLNYPKLFKAYQNKKITHQKLCDELRKYLLNFEIQFNLDIQDNNDEASTAISKIIAKSNIVTSTIHGTKGLEFDNTIIILTGTDKMHQDERRTMYVAATRAKNDELVIEVGANQHDPALFYQHCQDVLDM